MQVRPPDRLQAQDWRGRELLRAPGPRRVCGGVTGGRGLWVLWDWRCAPQDARGRIPRTCGYGTLGVGGDSADVIGTWDRGLPGSSGWAPSGHKGPFPATAGGRCELREDGRRAVSLAPRGGGRASSGVWAPLGAGKVRTWIPPCSLRKEPALWTPACSPRRPSDPQNCEPVRLCCFKATASGHLSRQEREATTVWNGT